ncbi:Transcriptional regulator LytR [Streptomyces sp. RB5]|uniref:Transcriptional regulator LytR n=1 Tax=Streptomyces smaragdinus TaxID=2585196 RepID=A0A7K0CRG0_9ACTN|nr:LCP family protein [Streptomyces smaragdinus]MQY16076.1 Transcriptional regulator LytR [Streptomyces smaragdinus]
MGRSSVRGGGAGRHRGGGGDRASDLGWDDSLYEGGDGRRLSTPPRQRSYVPGDDDDEYDDYEGEPPRKKRRWGLWLAATLAFLIFGTAGAGWLYYRHLNANLGKKPLNIGTGSQVDKKPPNAAGQSELNILLLGSDDRSSEANQKLGGARDTANQKPRADVQMLIHASADRSNMSVVSIPRDTMVNIPECQDPETDEVYPATYDRINTSLQHGGPGCTVATWTKMTGVHIDHFMMVEFEGVVSMADAVGGVPVCVNQNVYDKKSGLKLTAGTHDVVGKQALQWVRTRYAWGSDLGRAEAQHMYLNAMVRELKAGTKLTDPGQLMDLAEAATKALTVDPDLGTVKKLYDLGNDLKRVPTGRITMSTMPVLPDPNNPDVTLVENKPEAAKLWQLLRDDSAFDGKDKKKAKKKTAPTGTAHPTGDVPVTVYNGTGFNSEGPVPGRAAAVVASLQGLGYGQADTNSTPRPMADTSITYGSPEEQADALALAKAIGLPDRAVKEAKGTETVTLVVGADWRTGNTYPKTAGSEAPEKAPDSADLLNGEDDEKCMEVYAPYRW